MENNRQIGALWEKKNTTGGIYMSGNIIVNGKPQKIVCFRKRQKNSEKSPDWDILKSQPKVGLIVDSEPEINEEQV